MSDALGTYTFLPWMRRGIAGGIGGMSPAGRATVGIRVDISGKDRQGGDVADSVLRNVQLYGPADIIGIDRDEISRIEPENGVGNFEPNYLPAIDFYSEDFLWRYSPAMPERRRLRPWLALVVLESGEAGEFREVGGLAGRPLPAIEVTASLGNVFPAAADSWAWAHVHINAALSAEVIETDALSAAEQADALIGANLDIACCRLLSPRKLKPKTRYAAFLVPAFETGRLAGLGRGSKIDGLLADGGSGLGALTASWEGYAARPDGALFPFYHRWEFQTAERGDFESLVRLLKPQPVDPRVGHRDMDVTRPAPNIDGISKPEIGGILRLGGALKAPLFGEDAAAFAVFDNWAQPYPRPFQSQLAAFLNLADSYQADGAAANRDGSLPQAIQEDPVPLVTPPIYGRWHALSERVLDDRNGAPLPHRQNWLHDLNLDPRWRTAAGFGTKVIQDTQERWMEAAWDQVGDVIEANRRIRGARLATNVSRKYHALFAKADPAHPGMAMQFAAPVAARVITDGVTLRHAQTQAPLGVTLGSGAMRRAIRPRGPVLSRLSVEDQPRLTEELITRTNTGEITPARPHLVPVAALTPGALSDAAEPPTDAGKYRARIGKWIRDNRELALVLLGALVLLLLVVMPLFGGIALALAVIGSAVALWRATEPLVAQQNFAEGLAEAGQTPTAVATLPQSVDFHLVSEVDLLADPPASAAGTPGGTDSPEALRFKQALSEQYRVLQTSRTADIRPKPKPLDLVKVAGDVVRGLDPAVTLPRWIASGVTIPERIRDQMGERFVEAMAYPEFDAPMYEPLRDAGTELFVPNLNLVPPDSVTLLETNQRFIEAYMVGLNHEFARELLWREFPTDQRGSYFRQFWDVRKKLAQAADPEAAREALKDIRPIHRWPPANDLGDNDNREAGQEAEEALVLVIRGGLLKKYPNSVISAQPAAWQKKNGRPDKTRERVFDETVAPIAPLYEARVAPDIYFFGFDLTAAVARGDDTVDDKPGWFFRIEEVPGDARFGFDIARDPGSQINVWNDMSWADAFPGLADGMPLNASAIPPRALIEPTDASLVEKVPQWEDDRHVPLNANLSSAELAYITLQTPVLMGVHAAELLPDREAGNG